MKPPRSHRVRRFLIFTGVRKWLTYSFFILCSTVLGQTNLVINPSFEDYDTCPNNQDQVYFAPPWIGYATADYWNSCGPYAPQNWAGYQYARTGTGYVGIGTYGCTDCREYISGELTTALIATRKYCVEFYVSRSDCSCWASNQLGMYLSTSPVVYDNQGDTISVIPQIRMDSSAVMLDTFNWVRVSGIFTANGGERFIMLGNFYADNQTDTVYTGAFCVMAYYYIDDVAIYELQDCNAGSDFSICYKDSVQLGIASMPNVIYEWTPIEWLSDPNISNPVATPDTSITYVLKQTECDAVSYDTVRVIVNRDCHNANSVLIPNLLSGDQILFIQGLEANSTVDLYDSRGRLVYSFADYQNDFSVMTLSEAFYVCVLTRPNGETTTQKLVIVK
jgi:hypothetical protein